MIKTAKTDQPSSAPFFSIVIPTLNEEKFLPRLLNDIRKQTLKDFEVIHVDGESIDETCRRAAEFGTMMPVKTVAVSKRNVSHQRNTGGEAARGTWVIFMDADNRLKRTFLAQLKIKLESKPETDVFTCLLDTTKANVLMKNMLQVCNIILLAAVKVRPLAAGALIGVRRSHLKDLKFDCDVKMSEDHMFVEAAVKKGLKFVVFAQPRYLISLRRFEKEGSLKVLVDYARSGAVLLAGPKFERFLPEYPMLGGTNYDETAPIHGLLPSIRDIISVTTKSQQQRVQKSLSRFLQLINDI
jgi:glycosyltransferase involved in cell wall biosynthesis